MVSIFETYSIYLIWLYALYFNFIEKSLWIRNGIYSGNFLSLHYYYPCSNDSTNQFFFSFHFFLVWCFEKNMTKVDYESWIAKKNMEMDIIHWVSTSKMSVDCMSKYHLISKSSDWDKMTCIGFCWKEWKWIFKKWCIIRINVRMWNRSNSIILIFILIDVILHSNIIFHGGLPGSINWINILAHPHCRYDRKKKRWID